MKPQRKTLIALSATLLAIAAAALNVRAGNEKKTLGPVKPALTVTIDQPRSARCRWW